mmetsp:Transcript_18093/g.48688  ORF Transcript_18093/g.48688 Transcript_18093/m.48688 type:complete len:375 (-) Transcript_18093:837-1961(-)
MVGPRDRDGHHDSLNAFHSAHSPLELRHHARVLPGGPRPGACDHGGEVLEVGRRTCRCHRHAEGRRNSGDGVYLNRVLACAHVPERQQHQVVLHVAHHAGRVSAGAPLEEGCHSPVHHGSGKARVVNAPSGTATAAASSGVRSGPQGRADVRGHAGREVAAGGPNHHQLVTGRARGRGRFHLPTAEASPWEEEWRAEAPVHLEGHSRPGPGTVELVLESPSSGLFHLVGVEELVEAPRKDPSRARAHEETTALPPRGAHPALSRAPPGGLHLRPHGLRTGGAPSLGVVVKAYVLAHVQGGKLVASSDGLAQQGQHIALEHGKCSAHFEVLGHPSSRVVLEATGLCFTPKRTVSGCTRCGGRWHVDRRCFATRGA